MLSSDMIFVVGPAVFPFHPDLKKLMKAVFALLACGCVLLKPEWTTC